MAETQSVNVNVSIVKEEPRSDTEYSEVNTNNDTFNSSPESTDNVINSNIKNSLHENDVFKNIKKEPPDEAQAENYSIEIEIEVKQVKKEKSSPVKYEIENYSINKYQNQSESTSYFIDLNPQPGSSNYAVKIDKASSNTKPKDKKSLGYTCKSCYSYFASEQNLLVHIYKNQGRPFKCKKKLRPSLIFCAVCNNKYYYKQHLIRHLKTHFSCKFCSKTFATTSEKDSHMIIHIEIKCRFCDTKFDTSLLLQDHIRNVHGDRPFECKICKARFSTRYNLTTHETMHSDKKPFSCHICNKGFKVNAKLKVHILTHETGNFICDICKGSFKNSISLRNHITHRHKKRKHKCAICGEEYNDRPSLVEHRRKHYEELRFACEICNKRFKYKQSLVDHGVTHSGMKPHVCTICSKSFSVKTNLTAHIRNVHKKKEESNSVPNNVSNSNQ